MINTRSIFRSTRRTKHWLAALSAMLIVIGLVAIILPLSSGVAATALMGGLLIFASIVHLLFVWFEPAGSATVDEMIAGLGYGAGGAYLVSRSSASLSILSAGLVVYLSAEAILELARCRRMKSLTGTEWLSLSAILVLAIGVLIWAIWPSTDSLEVGTLIGICMVFSGISRLMLSLATQDDPLHAM